MIDPELKSHLVILETEVTKLRKRSTSAWQTLWHGIVYGAGYIIGAAIIVVIIGWILNLVGIIPALSRQVSEFRSAIQSVNNQ